MSDAERWGPGLLVEAGQLFGLQAEDHDLFADVSCLRPPRVLRPDPPRKPDSIYRSQTYMCTLAIEVDIDEHSGRPPLAEDICT